MLTSLSAVTHKPNITTYKSKDGSKKLLVNSGSWIIQRERDTPYDTFVYIDNSGFRVLQWLDDKGYASEIKNSLL